MDLLALVTAIADSCVAIDSSGVPFKHFRPGVGPYGEPQLVRLIAKTLAQIPEYNGSVAMKRTPDLLVATKWAIEFKIARPFGDNGAEAENWSVNLLHPYPGSTSVIGDCLKLLDWTGPERRVAVVIGYEHDPPRIDLEPLLTAFEMVASGVIQLGLGDRVQVIRSGLVHPVHQRLRVTAWEVLGRGGQRRPRQSGEADPTRD